jgi:hypothetical protein
MRMRRNLESLSFRFLSRCLRTATAFKVDQHNANEQEERVTNLLDQHVKVLWDFWCEACYKITPSVKDQAEA